MESKPLITFAGDKDLFSSIQSGITDGLPEESVEWTRSYGRGKKTVCVAANFVAFSEDILPKEGERSLLDRPYFHTYWTDCNDVENYKQTVRDDITTWITKLKERNINDWLIVVIEHIDNKKGNKAKLLTRTTVLDKIKNDLPSKGSERCISLLDPCKTDARAAESWQLLMQRIREMLLQAYSKQLSQYEEYVRSQREKRNEPGWNFQNFFFLQEELAFVFEMFGVYDEALVQYDELDALFTQFVINSNVGDMPDWLNRYTQNCDIWSGVCLLRKKYLSLREMLQRGEGCLLDLRNYLFSSQCNLLLLLCRPWEVAQRTLPFLLNCVSELRILEMTMPPGSVACWVFLSCLEVLKNCERFSDSAQMEAYSLYTARLWAHAREKLHELGLLCGLMPDMEPTSQQLHFVVGLLSGMGEDPYPEDGSLSPQARLREALSSKESFLKHYLELSEITMGTFKHIGRIRTARYIGKDMAQLYKKLGQPEKAVSFLSDMLKTFREENWELLIAETQQEMAACYHAMNDIWRYLKMCARVSASPVLDIEERIAHFYEVLDASQKLGTNEPLLLRTEKMFLISGIVLQASDEVIICGSEVKVLFTIISNLPQEIICRNVKLSLKYMSLHGTEKMKESVASASHLSPKSKKGEGKTALLSPASPLQSGGLSIFSHGDSLYSVPPDLVVQYIFNENGSLKAAGIICRNVRQVLRRRDSQGGLHREKDIAKDDYHLCIKDNDVKLVPGKNDVNLKMKVKDPGNYTLSQLCMEWGNIHFILPYVYPRLSFSVIHKPSVIELLPPQGDLVAGIEQTLLLEVNSGSNHIEHGTSVNLKSSPGLQLKDGTPSEEWSNEISIPLPDIAPFQLRTLSLKVLAHFGPQRTADTIEHKMVLQWSWATTSKSIQLHFLAPFLSSHKLHTCSNRKYIQVVVDGLTKKQFNLIEPQLKTEIQDVLKPLNPPLQTLVVSSVQTSYFLWELIHEQDVPLKFFFTVSYGCKDDPHTLRTYSYDFFINNYVTMYGVSARVEPPKGSEFCKAGSVCHMHINITQLHSMKHPSLIYEVVPDQTIWAVCGRTAGVITIDDSGKHSVTIEVMPLIGGFLPFPSIRLSKYIPADQVKGSGKEASQGSAARLDHFENGQVYNWSQAMQVHVLPATSSSNIEVAAS